METEAHSLDNNADSFGAIYPAVALFEEEFSLDWIIESTFQKASTVLLAMEQAVAEGWLEKGERPDVYFFRDSRKRKEILGQLEPDEINSLRERVVAILKIAVSEEDKGIEILAHHLLQTSNDVEGCRWLFRAADAYRKNFDVNKAIESLEKCLHDLFRFQGLDADQLYVEASIAYSRISLSRQSTTKINRLLQEAMKRASKRKDKASFTMLEMQMAKNQWLQSKYSSALSHVERVRTKIKDLSDPSLAHAARTFIISFLSWQGQFREAVLNYEQFIKEEGGQSDDFLPVRLEIIVGVSYSRLGEINQGLGMVEKLRRRCVEKGDRYQACVAMLGIAAIMLENFRIDDAIQYLEQSMAEAIRENHDFVINMAHLFLARTCYLKGEKERSLEYLRKFLKQTKKVDMTVRFVPYLMDLCWEMEQGRFPRVPGLSLAKEINLNFGRENIFLKGIAHRYRALTQRKEGLPGDTIIQSLQHSIKWLEKSGHQMELATSRSELARQYLLSGERDKARELALKASKFLNNINPALIPDDLRSLIGDAPLGENLLQNILKLSKEIVCIRDHKKLVYHILSTAMRITGAERGAIFLFENEETFPSQANLMASRNLTSEEIDHESFDPIRKMIEEVAVTGQSRIVRRDTDVDSPTAETIRSQICVPMFFRDKIVGILYHENRFLDSAFRESDLDSVSYFASQAAIALDNARIYNELNRINAQLKEEKHYYEQMNLQTSHFDEIVGESPEIQKILAQVDQVADKEVTVIILGETGVGKELIARAIHRRSARNEKPFIGVNCSALSESLMTSELFGHEKGAFTGAVRRRIGRFELADGGTLFLDEIGDLPMDVQVRLLRVLQTKEFERVGGEELLRSDYRLLCATNSNLQQKVKAGTFREDLYYRLNVFPIYIPPLRDRRGDIKMLAHYFVKKYADKLGSSFEAIPQEEIDKLMTYDWPGNVREFENVIERSVILSTGPYFRAVNLDNAQLVNNEDQPAISLKENEKRHIKSILLKTGWKVRGPGGAAEVLDINPSTLISRMKKLGINRPKV